MRSTTQDDFFSGKSDFKIWSDTFGVKINRYYADNGEFYEQPFRSKIEDSNQTKECFGVRSHNQNSIFERKIQTLTLGPRTLLLHEKIYWTEAMNTMLWTYALKAFA